MSGGTTAFDAPNVYKVIATLDLDGDGKMEIVVGLELLRRRSDHDLSLRSEEGGGFTFSLLRGLISMFGMRTISALAVILIGICLVPSLQAKDIIMDKSPDGNFALRIQLPKEAGDQPKVGMINLLTQEAVRGIGLSGSLL